MPNERKRVNLSTTASRIRGGLKFGDEQGMRTHRGTLNIASIFMNIITSILDLYKDPEVRAYLNKKGWTFLEFIHRSARNQIASDRK